MKLFNALRLYRVRLRARLLQECFAVMGIAAGVALLFASQVSSASLQSSVGELSRGIFGKATLQLLARDPHGFPEDLLARVRAIPGVRFASPLLESGANIIGPSGNQSVELIGADESLGELDGRLLRHTSLSPFGGIGGVVLPAPLAKGIGVTKFGQEATFQLAGRSATAPLYAQLHQKQIGPLIASPIAVVPLSFAQEMMDSYARVSRILVEPSRGSEARVRSALLKVAAGRLDVESASYDEGLFRRAATASNQSTAIFSVISALVGFLFAFNAVLFTVPQRRRLIVDLRRDGYTPQTVIAVLLLDALILGLVACGLGFALGDELSLHLFHSNTAFLSLAFTVGSERVVSWQSIAIATTGGMLAASVAVLSPLRDILSRDPLAAVNPQAKASLAYSPWRLAFAGVACLAATGVLLLFAPDATIPAMVILIAALLLELPIALNATLALVGRIGSLIVSPVAHIATMELGAARTRAIAIAATGAIAVFGSVAIQGAHSDLLRGLERAAHETNELTDLWVAPAGSYDLLHTTPFRPVDQTKLARLPGIRAVEPYRSGLLDYGTRRLLVIAPSKDANPLLPAGQLIDGNLHQATKRVRLGGWLVLSKAVAEEHHLGVGQTITLPTPNPTPLRVAALSTNIGWAPGSVVMNAADYARAWGSQDISAYEVLLDPSASAAQSRHEIQQVLGTHAGLSVESATEHAIQQSDLSRKALERLTQIATLIPIAAVFAMAAAIGAMIWQRRPRLAKLKLEGLPRVELWYTILLESTLLLGVGCLTGAVLGLYAQQLADRALAHVINFPVVHSIDMVPAFTSISLVAGAALAIVAIPGYLAASVPAALALQD